MQIKNIAFNKGDYRYSIEYFDGKAVRKISTNEEALSSFDVAVSTLAISCKNYLKLDDGQNVTITHIRFGKNDDAPSSIFLNAFGAGVEMNIKTRLIPVHKEENYPDLLLIKCNDSLSEVYGECVRYLNGERAQSEFSFDFEDKEE